MNDFFFRLDKFLSVKISGISAEWWKIYFIQALLRLYNWNQLDSVHFLKPLIPSLHSRDLLSQKLNSWKRVCLLLQLIDSLSGTGSPSRSPSPDGITENAPQETRIRKWVTDESPSARKKGNQISTTNTESDKSNETSSNSTRVSANQQTVYHRGQPTAIPIV